MKQIMEEKTREGPAKTVSSPGGKPQSRHIWKNYGYYIFFILTFIMYELMLRISTVKQLGFTGFMISVAFNLVLALLICYAMTFVSKRARVIVNNLLLIVAGVLYISQIIYYNVFATYYNTESMSNAGQIIQFWETILSTAWAQIIYILLCIAPVPVYNIFVRKTTVASVEKKIRKLSRMEAFRLKRRRSISLAAVWMVYIAILIAFIPFAKDPTTAYSMFFGQQSYEDSIKRTGLLSTLQVDLLKVFVKEDDSGSLAVIEEPGNSHGHDNNPGPGTTGNGNSGDENPDGEVSGGDGGDGQDGGETSPPAPIEYGYNVMDIDFDKLISNESNNAVKGLHEYFAYVRPSSKNEYTGIYEGYNLLMFCAEGFSHYVVDPELTPTLYKLVNEGFHFTDFYTPAWGVSTTDGEYVACTGLIPKSGVWSFFRSSENYLPFVMGNQLKKLGYKTNAYHNHTYTYYRRNLSHPNMGYVYKGVGNGLVLPRVRWPNSDLEMMEATMDEYINSQPFHAYYMTVSGHLEYNFMGNAMAARNKEAVANLPYSDACKAYIACNIELDKALAYTLERLNQAGIAEKTLIVLSADHHPYGLPGTDGVDGMSEFLGRPVEKTFEMYKNSCIIYVQGMEPVTIDEPCSSLDIIPTISNLLGLEFDSRLLMGRDVMSGSAPLVILKDRSYITDKGRYTRGGKFVPNPGVEVEDNYARVISSTVDAKFNASARILEQDYYRKVFK